MASKYPSVTVATKAKAANAPPTVKGGKPLNKGQFGTLSGVPKTGKVKIAPLPKKFHVGWGTPLQASIKALADTIEDGQRIQEALRDDWQLGAKDPGSPLPSSAYWTYTPCAGTNVRARAIAGWRSNSTCTVNYLDSQIDKTSPTTRTTILAWSATFQIAGANYRQYVGTYFKRAGAPTPTPLNEPAAFLAPAIPAPWEWPLAQPIAVPKVAPQRAPWTKPKPGEEPSEKPEEEPKPAFAPNTSPIILPHPGLPIVRVTPGRQPIVFPGVVVKPAPQQPGPSAPDPTPGVVVQPSEDFGKPNPPPSPGGPGGGGRTERKTVEKKAKVSMAVGLAWAGINSVTEAMDFIVAMHKSIPKGKGRLSAKASKAQVIEYMMTTPSAWRRIDLAEALQNYINMQIGDMAAALGSQSIKRVMQDTGMITGLDRALRAHADNLGELDTSRDDNWTDLIPTLDIDRENGVISIIGPLGVLRLRRR